MLKYRTESDLNLAQRDALMGCHKAIESLGWRVIKQSENSIVCKEPFSFGFTWPAQIEITLNSKSTGSTTVTLNGSISGAGPIQSRHLNKQMALLLNRIALATGTRAAVRTCRSCHSQVPEGAGFCPKCGKEVAGPTPDGPPRSTPHSRRMNVMTMVFAGIINVALFIVALTQKSWANVSFVYIVLGSIVFWIGLIMVGVNVFKKKILKRPGIALKRWGLLILLGLVFSTMGYTVQKVNPAGSIASTTNRVIKASEGGEVSLPSGTMVSIPAGLLTHDGKVTLSRQESSPTQIPNKAITSVGPALFVSFEQRSTVSSKLREFVPLIGKAWAAPPGEVQVSLKLSKEETNKLEGSIPFADVVHTDGSHEILGLDSQYDSAANIENVKVPLLRPEAVKEFTVSHARLKPAVETARLPTPGGKTWDGSRWVDGTSGIKSGARTLVMVHGMLSSVEQAYPCTGIKGRYDQVVGFNYNWTQGLEDSGRQLAAFLDQLKAAGITEVDIEAHSEGVPVSLSAYARTSMPVKNMVLLGGPIMGTPAASRADLLSSLLPTTLLNWGPENSFAMLQGRGDISLKQVLNGQFAQDLRPDSDTLAYIRGAVAQKMNQAGAGTRLITVAGTNWSGSGDMTALGLILQRTYAFLGSAFDGIVGENSALGLMTDGKESGLRVAKRLRHPVSHTQLACDPQVTQDISKELNLTPTPPTPPPTPTPTPTATPSRVTPPPSLTPTPTPTQGTSARPDLTLTSVNFSPSSGKAGQNLSVTFTIKNQGDAATGPFSNRISLATTRYGTNYSLGNFAMEPLPAGASRTLTLVSNAIPTSIPDGSYWVTVFTDGFQQVNESEENNNIGSQETVRFALSVATPPPTSTPRPVSGTWKGQAILTTNVTGAACRFGGDITLSLTQIGETLRGTVTYDLGGDPNNSSVRCPATRVYGTAPLTGTIKGSRDGGSVKFSFTTTPPFAGFTINASGLAFMGAFIEGDFTGDATGQFHVEPQ